MIKSVDGVLKFNNDIRDEMLKRNIGKYSQWKETLSPAIGEYYDIDYDRELKDLKDGKDLLTYTHDGKSEYSEKLNRRVPFYNQEEPYSVRPLTYGELNPWVEFQNGGYIQYIDEVLGKDDVMRHVDYINNLLSGQFIENALRQTEVGVIDDINVAVALQGVITTNPNNMSGKDTILGQIGNRMYAQTLYNGAIFNSDRMKAKIKVGENYYNKSYITPYLVNQYGNNLSNVFNLSDIMKIGVNETGIREDLGADVKILDGRSALNFADLSSDEFRFLREQIESKDNTNKFSLLENDGYVNWVKDENEPRYQNTFDNAFTFLPKETKPDGTQGNSFSGRISSPYMMSVYNEGEWGGSTTGSVNIETLRREHDEFNSYAEVNKTQEKPLLSKTARLFDEHKIDTMIARFHNDPSKFGRVEFTDTARSAFGNSHGRNLLTLDAYDNIPITNDYENPYCRTWTFHHQYNQVKKLIRPFILEIGDNARPYTMKEIQSMNRKYRAYRNDNGTPIVGYESLAENTVLQDNGFVRITPHTDKDGKTVDKIKNCMFSIENLAWKDVLNHEDNLSAEQRGPNGGRIMWFPPYDLDFQESVNVEWGQNSFIGRGEKVYTYTNTDRQGTLSFSILIDHPAIINSVTKNSYIGMGREQDPEVDILRFFAGCNLLPETNKLEEKKRIIEKEEKREERKSGSIKFKIYFPNNFSGILTNKFKIEGLEYDELREFTNDKSLLEYPFDLWWMYILVGNGTCIPENPDDYRGYEMSSEGGISTGKDIYDIPLPTCVNNEKVEGTTQVNEDDKTESGITLYNTCIRGLNPDKDKMYHYQVDEDLHQLIGKESFVDSTSFQLNVNFNKRTEDKIEVSDNEYTFAEVIMALLKNNPNYSQVYQKFKPYVIDKILEKDESRINDLYNIFSNSDIKIESITYQGSADNNDISNAPMLSFRRGIAGSNMIRELLGEDNNNSIKIKRVSNKNETGGNSNVPAFDYGQKKFRSCEFTINYTLPTIASSSKTYDVIDDNDTEVEVKVTYKEYLDKMLASSEVINEYYSIINGYDNGALDNTLQGRFNELGTDIVLNDDTFVESEIEYILSNYVSKDAMVLAYAIASEYNSCFRDAYFAPNSSTYHNYSELVNVDGTDLLNEYDSSHDADYFDIMLRYFVTNGAQISNYNYTGDNPDDYNISFTEFPYENEFPSETVTEYNLSIAKLMTPFVLGHYMQDMMNNIYLLIQTKKDKDEYTSLILKDVATDSVVTYSIMVLISSRDDYNKMMNSYHTITDEITNEVRQQLNTEIRAIEDAEKQAEKEAERTQKIEEIRRKSEEDKAALEAFKRDYTIAYGPDKDKIPNIRYETEADYFKTIDVKDPLLYKNLKEKFKYFNPAFHAISPEGFNARLTFLHQCTRQGQTCEAKIRNGNKYTGTASNLAFGRMPVCVIRIGDFINTKAIINSMTISYAEGNGVLWDLNPEGAGVQPMYAKVSLNITLLGGQSLGAPISRLQNAITFNYYANAEVYDNRADVAVNKEPTSDDKSTIQYRRIWSPLSNEMEWKEENGRQYLAETGKLVNNDTDDFNKKHSQDASWRDLTNEEIAEMYGIDTPPAADDETIVYSSEITDFVFANENVSLLIEGFIEDVEIAVYCNVEYIESSYLKNAYKTHKITRSEIVFKEDVVNPDYITSELDKAIEYAVTAFIESHN